MMNQDDLKLGYDFIRKFQKNPLEIRVFDAEKYPQGKSVTVQDFEHFLSLVRRYNESEKINVYWGSRDRIGKGDANVQSSNFIFFEVDEHDTQKPNELPKIQDFCKKYGLKLSMILFSGGGYHFYLQHNEMTFLNDTQREHYKTILDKFRESLLNAGIDIDRKVFNLERVARIPGTFNYTRNQISKIMRLNGLTLEDIETNTQNLIKLLDLRPVTEKKEIETDHRDVIEILQRHRLDTEHPWLKALLVDGLRVKEDCGGNSVVFRQAATLFIIKALSDDEIKILGHALADQCEGRTYEMFYGWVKRVKNGKELIFWKKSIDKWIEEHGYPITKYISMTDEIKSLSTTTLKEIFANPIKPIAHRIQNLLVTPGITIIGGTSGCGKTWLALLMAMCISSGRSLFDRWNVLSCVVLYVDEENGKTTLSNRFKMLKYGHGFHEDSFDNLHISEFNDVKLDTQGATNLDAMIERIKPGVVFIDSAVRCMIGEEDKAKDVRRIFDNLKNLMVKYHGISFVILHHTTKGGNRGMDGLRGSGDFAAMADVVLMCHENPRNPQFTNCEFVKARHMDKSLLPAFSIKREPYLEKNLKLVYFENTKEESNAIKACCDDLLHWFEDQELEKFESKKALNYVAKLGHTKDAFYKAIKQLETDKEISKLTRGKYKVKTIKDIVDKED